MAEDYSKIYLFLGQQGTNWHHTADSNRDGVLIKTEWTNFVDQNWDDGTLGEKSPDLVKSFFDNILNTTKGYAKAGSTNYNQSSAVDQNEANNVAAVVAVYSLMDSFEEILPGFNGLPAAVRNSLIQYIANKVNSAGISADNIREAIAQHASEWGVYSYTNNILLANKKQEVVGGMLTQAGVGGVSVDLPEITQIWNNCLQNAGISVPVQNDSFITNQLTGLNCSEIQELINGTHAPLNGATPPNFAYVSEIHKPHIEKQLRNALASLEGYQHRPEAFSAKISEFVNTIEQNILNGTPSLQNLSEYESHYLTQNNITSQFGDINTQVMKGVRLEEYLNTNLEKYRELNDTTLHDGIYDKLKAAMHIEENDDMLAVLNNILDNSFQDYSENVINLLREELLSNPDSYLNGTQVNETAIREFFANAILENIDDFINFDKSMELDEMQDYFDFAYTALNSAENGELSALKHIAYELCTSVMAKGYQTQVINAFGTNYQSGIENTSDRDILKGKIEALITACQNAPTSGAGGGGSTTAPDFDSSHIASDTSTMLPTDNGNMSLAEIWAQLGDTTELSSVKTITCMNVEHILSNINNKIDNVVDILKTAYPMTNFYEDAVKSIYRNVVDNCWNNKKTHLRGVDASVYNRAVAMGSETYDCYTMKTSTNYNSTLGKIYEEKMKKKSKESNIGLAIYETSYLNDHNRRFHVYLDMARVVELLLSHAQPLPQKQLRRR